MIQFKVKGKIFTYIPKEDQPILQNQKISNNRLVVLLNNTCNLNCIYCYSAGGRAQKNPQLTLEDVIPGIDYICEQQEKEENGYVKLDIYGGGEPFVSRKVLKETVEYFSQRAKNIRHDIKILTNGTLLREDDLAWLKEHDVMLSFSFEVFKDIQEQQRGCCYEIVDRNIRMSDEAGIKYRIWTIVTPRNVNRLEELLEIVKIRYPHVKRINMESVVSEECTFEMMDQFLKSFLKAKRKAKELGLTIHNSRITSLEVPKMCHCDPELCITNEGFYTCCHTTSSNPAIKEDYAFGKDLKTYIASQALVNKSIQRSRTNNCENCIAKPWCAGGCTYVNVTSSNIVVQSICRFMINVIKLRIVELEDPQLFNEYLSCDQTFDEFAANE